MTNFSLVLLQRQAEKARDDKEEELVQLREELKQVGCSSIFLETKSI